MSISFVVISLEPHRYLHLTGIKRWLWTCEREKEEGQEEENGREILDASTKLGCVGILVHRQQGARAKEQCV